MAGSFDQPPSPVLTPSPWVAGFAHLIPAGSRVLDVACGHGRHTRLARSLGHPATAVDIDTAGVADLAADPGVTIVTVDLETGDWPFAPEAFGAVIVANYLHRPHFPHLAASLQPRGVLLVDTFGAGNERHGRPRNPDFLLATGELLTAFAGRLQVVAYECGYEPLPRPSVRQRLCAVRTVEPVPLRRAEGPGP
jgi:SAM-dependent methyltransferase